MSRVQRRCFPQDDWKDRKGLVNSFSLSTSLGLGWYVVLWMMTYNESFYRWDDGSKCAVLVVMVTWFLIGTGIGITMARERVTDDLLWAKQEVVDTLANAAPQSLQDTGHVQDFQAMDSNQQSET